jgi:hypothetical protein
MGIYWTPLIAVFSGLIFANGNLTCNKSNIVRGFAAPARPIALGIRMRPTMRPRLNMLITISATRRFKPQLVAICSVRYRAYLRVLGGQRKPRDEAALRQNACAIHPIRESRV